MQSSNVFDSLPIRFIINVFVAMGFAVFHSAIFLYIMLFLVFLGLVRCPKQGPIAILFLIMIAIQIVWVILAVLIYELNLSPLKLTYARASVLQQDTLLIVAFVSAQFLFIMTCMGAYLPKTVNFKTVNKAFPRLIALLVAVATTLIINRGQTFLQGPYLGNLGSYWSGLPAIFIIAIAAWILLQKKYGLLYVLLLNSIVAWWLMYSNRSEILVLFVFGNFLFVSNSSFFKKYKRSQIILIIITLLAAYFAFSFIGTVRETGDIKSFSFGKIFSEIVSGDRIHVQTYGSSIYSAIVSVNGAKIDGLLWGGTYWGQLQNTIPSFIPMPWERYVDVSEQYLHFDIIGGFGFLGEGYINFGLIGPVIVITTLTLIIKALAKSAQNSFIASWFLISIALYSQRILLYGTVYLYKLIVFFALIYLISKILSIILPSKLRLVA